MLLLSAAAAVAEVSAPGHVPDPMLVPMFRKPGEAHLSASLGQKWEGLDLRGGQALDSHWAWVAAASYANRDRCPSCNSSVRRHLEAGFGYFAAPSASPPAASRYSQWGWESYVGLGLGRFKVSRNDIDLGFQESEPEEIGTTSGRYGMLYMQAGVGRRSVWTDNAFTLRMAAYRYRELSVMDGLDRPVDIDSRSFNLFLEPAYTLGLGYKAVKVRGELGFSIPMPELEGLKSPRAWLSLGVAVNAFGK